MTKKLKPIIIILALIGAVYYLQNNHGDIFGDKTLGDNKSSQQQSSDTISGNSHDKIADYFEHKVSGKMISVQAAVTRILSDDTFEPRHQRFIITLDNGLTVLISHNIDLAPRVSGLNIGDMVKVTGQYEWNEKGGVIHWTHHDPRGQRQGGQIVHQGTVYR